MDGGIQHPSIERAFAEFLSQLQSHGFALSNDIVVAQSVEARSVTAQRSGAALRMVWTDRENLLILEVSHGPATGTIAGWFDLYRAALGSIGLQSDQADFTLESAIIYGLELLGC